MGYVDEQLGHNEKIILRINHGADWYDRLLAAVGALLLGLILVIAMMGLTVSILKDFRIMDVPREPFWFLALVMFSYLGCLIGLPLLAALVCLSSFVHIFWDDLALTDQRLVGRWQGRGPWTFRRVDLPLAQIAEVQGLLSHLKIKPLGAKPFLMGLFPKPKVFAEKMQEIIRADQRDDNGSAV